MDLKYKFDNRPHVIPEALRSTQENRIMKADWGTPAQGIAKDTAYSTGRHFDHCFLLVLLYVYVDLFIEVVVDLHAVIRKNADIWVPRKVIYFTWLTEHLHTTVNLSSIPGTPVITRITDTSTSLFLSPLQLLGNNVCSCLCFVISKLL